MIIKIFRGMEEREAEMDSMSLVNERKSTIEDVKKIIGEYDELISSTNLVFCDKNEGNFNDFLQIAKVLTVEEMKRYIIRKTKLKANNDLVERFLIEKIRIAGVNEEMVGLFHPFNNFRFGFDHFEEVYSYTSFYESEMYPMAIEFFAKNSNDEDLEKARIKSIFCSGDESNKIEREMGLIISKKYFNFLNKELNITKERIRKFVSSKE